MKKLFLSLVLISFNTILSQTASRVNNAQNSPQSVANPTVLLGANTAPDGQFKVYLKSDIRWETYNINDLNTQIIDVTSLLYQPIGTYLMAETDPTVPIYSKTLNNFSIIKNSTDPLYKSISYTPSILEITTALGFTPYNSTNPAGYISSVPAQSFASLTEKPTTISGYGITDAYPLIGNPSNFLTTINSAQVTTALGFTPVINSRTLTINGTTQDLTANRSWAVGDILSSGNYANPTWISSLAYSKLTGAPTIPAAQINSDWNSISGISQITNKPVLSTVATSGNYNDLTNKPAIPVNTDYVHLGTIAGGAGNVIFYLTSDKTSTGTGLYTTVTYVNPIVNDSSVNYSYGWSYNSTTKALTVNTKSAVGLNVALLGLTLLGLPSNAPNGTNVSVLVKGN